MISSVLQVICDEQGPQHRLHNTSLSQCLTSVSEGALKKLPLAFSVFQFINLPLIGCDAKVVNFFNPTG